MSKRHNNSSGDDSVVSGQRANNKSSRKKTKKEKKAPRPAVYHKCPEPILWDDEDSDTDDWRFYLAPTILSLVTQSVRKSEHNYCYESILLVQNLCKNYSLHRDDYAEFLDDTICQWEYRKDGSYLCGFGFPVRKDISIGNVEDQTLSGWIEHTHYCISQINIQYDEWKLSRNSVVYEMVGQKRYAANTWQRLDILGLAFSVVSFVFVEATYIPIVNHPFRKSCLDFTFDLMVILGKHKKGAINFIYHLCLAVDEGLVEDARADIISCWSNHLDGEEAGLQEFFALVMIGAQAAAEDGKDLIHICTHVENMRHYLNNRNKGTYMSFRYILSRAYKGNPPNEKTPKRTVRPPTPPGGPNEVQSSQTYREAVSTYWSTLACKSYMMFLLNAGDLEGPKRMRKVVKDITKNGSSKETAIDMINQQMRLDKEREKETDEPENEKQNDTEDAGVTKEPAVPTDGVVKEPGVPAENTEDAGVTKEPAVPTDGVVKEPGVPAENTEVAGETKEPAVPTDGVVKEPAVNRVGRQDSAVPAKNTEDGVTKEPVAKEPAVPQKEPATMAPSKPVTKPPARKTKRTMNTKSQFGEELSQFDWSHQYRFAERSDIKRNCCEYMVNMVREMKTKFIIEMREMHVIGIVRPHQYKACWRLKTNGLFQPSDDDEHEERKWRSGLLDFENDTRTIVGAKYVPDRVNAFHKHHHFIRRAGEDGMWKSEINFHTIMRGILSKKWTDVLPSEDNGSGFIRRWCHGYQTFNADILGEMRKVAMLSWALAKEFWPSGTTQTFYQECEAGADGAKFRKRLLIDPSDGDEMGFSFGSVELIQPLGGLEVDFSNYAHDARPYEIGMVFCVPLLRMNDNLLFYVVFNFYAGPMDYQKQRVPYKVDDKDLRDKGLVLRTDETADNRDQ